VAGRLPRAIARRLQNDASLAVLDALLVVVAYCTIFVVRFDLSVPPRFWSGFRTFLPIAVVVHLLTNWRCGLYGQMWRHASLQEACRVVVASGLAMCVLIGVAIAGPDVPLSVNVFGAFLATMLLGGIRFQYRLFALRRAGTRSTGRRVLVIGAGESAASVIREMQRNSAADLLPVALLDDDPRKQNRHIGRIPVVGSIDRLEEAVEHFAVDQALLAIPSADQELVHAVSKRAASAGVTLKILPRVQELLGGEVSVRDARDVRIEDLLGRKQVATDLDSVQRSLAGRRVLITGAGGSIGSEICRQVAECQPELLLFLDHDETHLHDMAARIPASAVQLLADVRDQARIFDLFARWQPEVVFHAAAHKHVPLLESHPREAVLTNVFGTHNIVAAAAKVGVERFVFISTDKAVHPSSVMGASKWFGEQLVLSQTSTESRFCAVRFGNVLGSRGSVIPTFAQQISAGGPVTVTDPRMTRYFMSTPEAVQLVLQAGAYAEGGEVFMLEMGEPARILDLAHRMIRLSGREVDRDISIKFTGVRPGEKIEEELRAPDEEPCPTGHPSIVRLRPHLASCLELEMFVDQLQMLVESRQDRRAAETLLAASNDPTVLTHLLAGKNMRRRSTDAEIRLGDRGTMVDLSRVVSEAARLRDDLLHVSHDREKGGTWDRPST
jgi:FlaA1/EpsC-like NDP-sugar epimerase